MTSVLSSEAKDRDEEIAALIAALYGSARRLESLTHGQVDSVADHDGHMFLLRHAQEHMRHSEAARQAAVLDALPAHIALLDDQGVIVSVNESWRRFGGVNVPQTPGYAIGINYMEICADAHDGDSTGANQVSQGIRSVLSRRAASFSLEYACPSPGEQRWFLCLVTPLADADLNGAVVMHMDITERKLVESRLRRLNRLHTVLSKVAETMVNLRDRQELYEAVCRIMVDDGLLRMAFIAEVDVASNVARPVASHGAGRDSLQEPIDLIPISGNPLSLGTVDTVLRTGTHDVCNDIAGAERMQPWHAAACRHGLLAKASFPLMLRGRMVGLLVLFAGETGYFQDDEIALMVAVAQAISFALEALENERLRQLADLALRHSEANMSAAQRIAHFGSWELELTDTVDVNANPLRWSDEMFRIAGYEPGGTEVSNEFFFRHVPEDDHTSIRQAVAEAIRAGGQYSIVHRLIRPGGEERIVHEVGQISVDENTGQPLRIIGTAHDITEHAQSEQSLRDSEERFRSMFTWTATGIAISTPHGRFLKANDAYCRMLGYTEGELQERDFASLTHPEDLALNLDLRNDVLAGRRETFVMEKRYLRKNGEIVWTRASISAVRNPDGRIAMFIVVAEDITERKHAEFSLHALSQEKERQERVLHTTLASIADFAYIFDRDGRFLFANQPLLDLWGLALNAAVGRTFFDLGYPKELATKLQGQIQEVFETRNRVTDETIYAHPDGQEGAYEYIFSPVVGADGMVEFVVGSTRDITQRKRSELEISRINNGLRESELRIRQLNRVHAVLSSINSLIVRVTDREELFREACRIAVDEGGFRMAMIVTADLATGPFALVASAGKDEALVGAIRKLLASPEQAATTMVARSMRGKSALVSHDLTNDAQVLLARHYVDAGISSLAVLPLIVAGEAVGTLVLYACEAELFHAEEMKLLTELSGDIAFAIDHINKSERLGHIAFHDELTNLPNRRLLLDRVTQRMLSAISGGYQLAVLLFDIERFKDINDSLGRAAGDALLKQVADWLIRETPDASLLARLGADHFAIVLPEARADGDVARFLEETIAALAQHPFLLGDTLYRINIKVGVALFPGDGDRADMIFQHAEAALKKAKASGSRYLFFDRAMSDRVAAKLTLENKLKLAIDNEEFVLHYQPKVDLASGKLAGAEALIRWNDPSSGLVAPYLFIPILEETGLIHEVGRWALRKAVAEYLRWRDAGLPAVRIAVNVSPLQLRDRGFVDEIRHVIGGDARASEGLELEITESMIMEDVKRAIASLQAIRAVGVPIAIDDFGTGFSSLGYLSKLPIDTLKVDRSFVIDMTTSPEGLTLVSTIINLAHSLQLKVVAEGVETEEQKRLLHLLRCDEMQGYLFSKPVPADVFEGRFLALRPSE